MQAAKASGTAVSYDLNYRDSLWSHRGGRDAANELNRELLEFADVVFGVEDFKAGFEAYSKDEFRQCAGSMRERHPNLSVIATTLRDVRSASRHDLSGVCFAGEQVVKAKDYKDVEVLDRVGSGDAFAAGLIYGILSGTTLQTAIDLAAASAVLSMASLGDGSSATLAEIKRLAAGPDSRAVR
jgi:2-dehydro-3-deoxygluconokinase